MRRCGTVDRADGDETRGSDDNPFIRPGRTAQPMSDQFDQHAVRHRMKLLRSDGDVTLYENRDGVECPACGEPFSRVLLTERRAHSFDLTDAARLCVSREDSRLVVCTHGN